MPNTMKPYFLYVLLTVFGIQLITAQNDSATEVDSLYKEDQFYVGATYNLLGKKTSGLSQSGFSSGFHLGYIKDMPINARRNVAIGLGLGISSNSFNQNMLIDRDASGNYTYTILDDNETPYSKNKFTMYLIEAPLEFRWRTSTAAEYKFWRIYTGLKVGYVIANSSKFKDDNGKIRHTNIKDFNDFQYGLTLSVGYNTWNVHLYYGLNGIFSKDARINNESLNMNAIKIGLLFYLL